MFNELKDILLVIVGEIVWFLFWFAIGLIVLAILYGLYLFVLILTDDDL